MLRLRAPLAVFAATTLLVSCHPTRFEIRSPPGVKTTLIANVTIFDGTGFKGERGGVRVAGATIVGVGNLKPRAGEEIVDGGGLALAPGFIDTHSHADRGLRAGSDALGALSQGITTVIVGQDGSSEFPIEKFFERMARSAPVNVGSYVGHGTLRSRVMGTDYKRRARPDEIQKMNILLDEELNAGAIGLSTGLEYDPGIYSTKEEVRDLARRAGRYISHIRSEDRTFWDAIDEVLEIGRGGLVPVQVSHMKLAMMSIWGQADRLIAELDRARRNRGIDVTADLYPYRYWQSSLTVLFPERDFTDRAAAEFALREVAQPDSITLTSFAANPDYEGMTLAQIARARNADPASTLMALIREAEAARASGRGGHSIIATSMTEADIETILKWRWSNICTDGELDGKHPRGFGAFTRVFGHYVRERKVITFAEAIRKMTSLAAANVGISNRGTIAPGWYADLVLLDTATVADRATPENPHALSVGISKVWVNGQLAFDGGRVTGTKAGKIVPP